MPHSAIPEPGENETECARCGAHFSMDLTRCPNCGVNLYEPEEESGSPSPQHLSRPGLGGKLNGLFHRLTGKPYAVDRLFGAAMDQAELFDSLLRKTGGDRQAADRLVEFEREQLPQGNRTVWIQNAIRRWEKDQG